MQIDLKSFDNSDVNFSLPSSKKDENSTYGKVDLWHFSKYVCLINYVSDRRKVSIPIVPLGYIEGKLTVASEQLYTSLNFLPIIPTMASES